MKILMVAADPMEFKGMLRHLTYVQSTGVPVDWARSARLGTHEVMLAANGAGGKRAAAAVDTCLEDFRAEIIVSTGFCGALETQLGIADIVTGTAISTGMGTFPALQPSSRRPHHMGVVCSIDHIAQTAAEKCELRAGGCSVVEMEAGGVAERARTRGLRFYCVRVVTDLADEDLANDFNGALRPDGHFVTMRILRGTLRNPLVRLPELFRLRNRCIRASLALGEFIADCQF